MRRRVWHQPPSSPCVTNSFVDLFATEKIADSDDVKPSQSSASPSQDRRTSREWDASKVPPSQFQRPKGSIFATPATRDGHVGRADGDKRYWDKMKEKVRIDYGELSLSELRLTRE